MVKIDITLDGTTRLDVFENTQMLKFVNYVINAKS